MEQILTISCKLAVTPSQARQIDATLQAFADACGFVGVSTPETLTNAIALQALVYQSVREKFGLSANLAIRAIARVAGHRKAKKPGKVFAPTSVSYDARIFSFREKDWTVSLTLVGGRERFSLVLGDYQRKHLAGQSPTSATLIKRQDGLYFLQIQVKGEIPPPQETEGTLGLDLGRRDIAHTSEGERFSGKAVQAVRDRHAKQRQSLQKKAAKGTRSCRRRCRGLLQRLSGRERRYQRHRNHEISRHIVTRAQETRQAIALEDLSGIRERANEQPRSKTERRRSNSWAFYQLRQFISYKAAGVGVRVVLVHPAYTSQTCHRCLHLGIRSGKSFACPHCAWKGDADYNGACVIALLGAAVSRPGGPGLHCSLSLHASGLLKAHSL